MQLGLLLLICFVPLVVSQFDDLAVLTCQRDLFILPNHPYLQMRLDLSSLANQVDFLQEHLFQRLSCACPSLGKPEFLRTRAWWTPEFWLNQVGPRIINQSCFEWMPQQYSPIGQLMYILNNLNLQMDMSSCNYSLWLQGKGCKITWNFDPLGIKINLGAKPCGDPRSPATQIPYISLSCEGAMCNRFFMPCNSDSECPTVGCNQFPSWWDDSNTPQALYQWLSAVMILDSGDTMNWGVNFFQRAFTAARTYLYNFMAPYQTVQLKFCSLNEIQLQDYFVNDMCQVSYPPIWDFFKSMPRYNTAAGKYESPTAKVQVTCPVFSFWSGRLPDGYDVFNTTRMSGNKWRVGPLAPKPIKPWAKGQVLLDWTCDGQISFAPGTFAPSVLPMLNLAQSIYNNGGSLYGLWNVLFMLTGQSFTWQIPGITRSLTTTTTLFKSFQQDRAQARGIYLSDDAYQQLWGIPYFLQSMTSPPIYPIPKYNMSSLVTAFSSIVYYWNGNYNNIYTMRVNFPITWSFDAWKNTGVVSGGWDGLRFLFNSEAAILGVGQNCGDLSFPGFQFVCNGPACDTTLHPPSCKTQQQCPFGQSCQIISWSMFPDFDPAYVILNLDASWVQGQLPCYGGEYLDNDLQDVIAFEQNVSEVVNNKICSLNFPAVINNAVSWIYRFSIVPPWYNGNNVMQVIVPDFFPWTPGN